MDLSIEMFVFGLFCGVCFTLVAVYLFLPSSDKKAGKTYAESLDEWIDEVGSHWELAYRFDDVFGEYGFSPINRVDVAREIDVYENHGKGRKDYYDDDLWQMFS